MKVLHLIILILSVFSTSSSNSATHSASTILHTLTRRPSPFNPTVFASVNSNLTYLAYELARTEARFNLTKREVKGNRLVRRPRAGVGAGAGGDGEGVEAGLLMGSAVAGEGVWFAKMGIGEPKRQEVEVDLNMLGADFWVRTTTGREGSRYDDFFSGSHVKNDKQHPFPGCTLPTDLFHLPTINRSVPLEFAYCKPRKASQLTLGPSGSMLGLAPSEHLSQTGGASILKQLVEKGVIEHQIFSITLVEKGKGILSIGGTIAAEVERVIEETRKDLEATEGRDGKKVEGDKQEGGQVEDGRIGLAVEKEMRLETSEEVNDMGEAGTELVKRDERVDTGLGQWAKDWAWAKTQGAEGWWQVLMPSVWVDGMKVLKNQAVVIDINTPFILAPPLAAKEFYASVSGAFQLAPPHSNFYAFPCLNPPRVDFEFGGSRFAFMRSARGQFGDWKGELPGGRFSLGRLKNGSGYCVGNVVATRMGLEDEKDEMIDGGRKGKNLGGEKAGLGGNGMRDVWVIGEGFFRGIGVAFDLKEKRVGFRTY